MIVFLTACVLLGIRSSSPCSLSIAYQMFRFSNAGPAWTEVVDRGGPSFENLRCRKPRAGSGGVAVDVLWGFERRWGGSSNGWIGRRGGFRRIESGWKRFRMGIAIVFFVAVLSAIDARSLIGRAPSRLAKDQCRKQMALR
jgi:hypothetical protein